MCVLFNACTDEKEEALSDSYYENELMRNGGGWRMTFNNEVESGKISYEFKAGGNFILTSEIKDKATNLTEYYKVTGFWSVYKGHLQLQYVSNYLETNSNVDRQALISYFSQENRNLEESLKEDKPYGRIIKIGIDGGVRTLALSGYNYLFYSTTISIN